MAALEIINYDRQSPSPADVDRLAEHIFTGGLAILPTDTVYGLVGDVTADPAARMIFRLKNRPSENPLPVFVDGPISLYRWYIRLRPKYIPLAQKFWPGPLTLVVPVWPGFYLRVGGDGRSVGIRATTEPIIFSLMRKTNRYLFATSANRSGVDPEGFDIQGWLDDFPDVRILWYKPEGYIPQAVSSVVDLTGKTPVLLRSGAIPGESLKKFLPDLKIGQ